MGLRAGRTGTVGGRVVGPDVEVGVCTGTGGGVDVGAVACGGRTCGRCDVLGRTGRDGAAGGRLREPVGVGLSGDKSG